MVPCAVMITTWASGALLTHLAEQGESVDAGHPDVEEDEVEGLGLDFPQRGRAVLHRGDLVARPAESLLEDPA